MDNNFKKKFGVRVRYLRKLSGLSQEQLAERTGLSAKTISYIENGKNTISFNKLPLIASGLSVPVYKLFVSTDSINNKDIVEFLLSSANEKELNVICEIIKPLLTLCK